ncbi:MAG: amidohydrolase family protein, partial [Nocardioidaceae bacterium]
MASRVVAADWLVPVTSPPIRDGAVVLEDATVGWLGQLVDLPARWRDLRVDHRSGVIVPGLVNAHTHLQYTLFGEVGRATYASFEHWSFAFEDAYMSVADPGRWRQAALDGAQQVCASGTTVVAEIITNDEARGALATCHLTGIEYIEAIGHFERQWHSGARAAFLRRLDAPGAVRVGVSPHAPYSLDGAVIRDLVAIASERGMRVHSHVAESSVEANLYREGDRSVLEIYGDLRDEFELIRLGGSGHSTAAYADSVGLLDANTHLAHAIYLDRAERDLLLSRGTQVALCPRSNAVLGLRRPPVAAYLREGHEIAVGTDSLASCPSLDVLADVAELASIARAQGYDEADLGTRLVRAATLGGASALGMASAGYGALASGGPGDLAVFDVEVGGDGPEQALVAEGAGHCTLTIAGGTVVHD